MSYKLIRFFIFQIDKLLDSNFYIFHKIFLYFINIIGLFFINLSFLKNSTIVFYFKFLSMHYARYYRDFNSYCSQRKSFISLLINRTNFNHSTLNYKFENLACNENNTNYSRMIQLLQEESKKEDHKKLNQLLKVFKNKKALFLGPAGAERNLNMKDYDLIVLANSTKVLSKKDEKINKRKIVLFVNQGYYYRNEDKLKKIKKEIAGIFVKPFIKTSLPKFCIPNGLFFNDYGPMGAQNILYNIFLGKANSIYVDGVTGYLGSVVHKSGVKTYNDNKQHIVNNIRMHEPISNFCFIKNFLSLKICTGSQSFINIYSKNIEFYCKELDKKYKNYNYKKINNHKFHSK